ncbi:MAG: Lrp/AsnC family transcriptional regulator [Candidatus Micrarchaeota archaeon]
MARSTTLVKIPAISRSRATSRPAAVVPLADIVNSSIDTVRSRIKRMEKLGIIKGHKLSFNFSKINLFFFIVSVNLSNSSETARKKLENYCKSHSNSVYLVNLLGDHDLDLEVEVESQQQLDNFLRDLKNKFFEIIRDVEVIQVTNQHKLSYYLFL